MSTRDDRTADPLDRPSVSSSPSDAAPVVEILFHSDLRRVGERLWPAPTSLSDAPLPLGRDHPLFWKPGAPTPRSLLDPCISRHQLSVRWDGHHFHTEPAPDARRPLRMLDERGAARPFAPCPPGTLLAIGDRVLLRLDVEAETGALPDVVGSSLPMRRLASATQAVAARGEPVLLEGETGSGKERIAHALHALSPRASGPFVSVNCAALPDTLVESELFGHTRGAFSGATSARPGLFRRAEGGTLFLDEIGELPPGTQAKLLRALELKQIRPVGSDVDVPVDLRIVAATHRALEDRVRDGHFREDLLARLDGLRLRIPPLRERPSDVPLLLAYHLQRVASTMPAEAVGWLLREATLHPPPIPLDFVLGLLARPWPRNVRELEKLALSLVTHGAAAGHFLAPEPTPAPSPASALPALPSSSVADPQRSEPEARRSEPDADALRRLLAEHDYVQHRVARALGVPYATLDRWMQRHGIVRPRDLDADRIKAVLSGTSTLAEAAAQLAVSERGLRLRLAELDLPLLERPRKG